MNPVTIFIALLAKVPARFRGWVYLAGCIVSLALLLYSAIRGHWTAAQWKELGVALVLGLAKVHTPSPGEE